jgi:hypothetical protein
VSDELLLSREEVLAGLPARRSSTILFAIESRVAQLVARAHREAAPYLTEAAQAEREQAFLEALAAGRDLPLQPTVQDLERYAPHWASLLPPAADARGRAVLAHLLGSKYTFTRAEVPRLRRTLGLDDEGVRGAYQAVYGQPLEAIYAPQVSPAERLRWAWTRLAERLERLPAFWVAFAMTLPLSGGLLALPIAVADLGPLPAIGLLLVFGLVNLLTVAALAEAVARSGITRFGLGYLGQLVADYLGRPGSLFLTLVLFANNFLVLIIFYLGTAGTLEAATRVPSELWVAALFGAGIYFLSRKSLNATVASSLVVAGTNLAAILMLIVLALPRVQGANLAHVRLPFGAGSAFEPAAWQPVLGVLLSTFFSHALVANYGQVILRRDPSAHSWIWGCVAAVGAVIGISCLWVLAVNGAIAPAALAAETSTALVPLAALVGPAVNLLGSIYVILSLGMSTIHISLGTFYLVQERFPAHSPAGNSPGWQRLLRPGGWARFWLAASPVMGVFLVSEWASITGSGSFAWLLGFLGAFALPLLGGIFPLLLLAASRRKGDFVPAVAFRLLGHPVVLAGLYGLYMASLFAYGVWIYQTWLERGVVLLVGLLMLAVTGVILRRGALDGRAVVELRDDQRLGERPQFTVTDSGRPALTTVQLLYPGETQTLQAAAGDVPSFGRLQAASFSLPATSARQLKVWVHRITPEGNSVGLPVRVSIHSGTTEASFDVALSGGQILAPLADLACRVEIEMEGDPAKATGDA